ncbi:hypothetical protein EW145_g1522 [Phellinidium pouzarii]|uniref:Small ribosomal subunit protein mS23 n=1 Tax=Phellinidium pouzarii TaxID=167371 RepID=A0A4S4LER5_9AGAM|nr:hypothetical protein EW145_g1522 [Phellinidium pouzarii]
MVRRITTQVHKQVARLVRAGYIIKEPLWYKAVLEHPPFPLPARAPSNRSPPSGDYAPYDMPTSTSPASGLNKPAKLKVEPVVYLEDEVRQQFFRDHPFEAFRERTLVEEDLIEDRHPISGKAWTRLSQCGRNPTPEDAIRFAVNLYEHTDGMPLSDAYAAAVMQYRALRAEQQIATQIAAAEAAHYGMVFRPGAIERAFEREQEHLKSWEQKRYSEAQSMEARKRWRLRPERPVHSGTWTKGEEYVRLWREGVRPDYSPAIAEPAEEIPEEILAQDPEPSNIWANFQKST